jgi:hypothetical protein
LVPVARPTKFSTVLGAESGNRRTRMGPLEVSRVAKVSATQVSSPSRLAPVSGQLWSLATLPNPGPAAHPAVHNPRP